MLLFDLLDYIIFLIIRLLPILITIISVFIAYYFYKINSKVNIEKFKNNYLIDIKELCKDRPVLCDNLIYNRFLKKRKKYKPDNYFCGRQCYFDKNNDCIFELNEKEKFKCPELMCKNKNICKDKTIESFNNPKNKTIESFNNPKNFENYYCFQNDKCVAKKKNFMFPSKNTCCSPNISQYPNKIYYTFNECYNDNLAFKDIPKNKCLSLPHGYGYIDGYGCVKGTPTGPDNIFLNYGIYSDKRNYTPSNPNPYIKYDYKYNKYIYSNHL